MRSLVALLASALFLACVVPTDAEAGIRRRKPLDPNWSLPQYTEIGLVPVPGGAVNVMGGNLIVRRTDLSIDTRLGTQNVGAIYHSGRGGEWRWSFDLTWFRSQSIGIFTDATNSTWGTSSLSDGDTIPGSVWVKVDADRMKTKGGLVHKFRSDGFLEEIYWASNPGPDHFPKLTFDPKPPGAGNRRIQQCTQSGCSLVYDIEYDSDGQVIAIVDRANRRAEFEYDGQGRLTDARDGLDNAENWDGFRYTYVGDGEQLATITNSENEQVDFAYWPAGQLKTAIQMALHEPTHRFDYFPPENGLYKTAYKDPAGFTTAFRYDNKRHLTRVRRYLDQQKTESELTVYTWLGDRPTQMSAPAGVDSAGDPVTAVTTWTYDGPHPDDPDTMTLPSGNMIAIGYAANPDAVNRENVSARPIGVILDSVGVVETRTYFTGGQLKTIGNGEGDTTRFTYDSDEMIASVTDPAGVLSEYEGYGDDGHPTLVRYGELDVSYAYDAVGNLTHGLDFGDPSAPGWGGVMSRSFDEDRNVAQVMLAATDLLGASDPMPMTIAYRSDGRIDRIDRPFGGDTTFDYDALGRLETRSDKASGSWHDTSFSYDLAGRPASIQKPNGMQEDWTYDALGRVKTYDVSGSTAVYVYDNGRLASIDDDTYSDVESYTYDSAGRVALITFPAGESLQNVYDLRSRVVANLYWESGVERQIQFAYDDADRNTLVTDATRGVDLIRRTYTDGRLAQAEYQDGDTVRTTTYEDELGTILGTDTVHSSEGTIETTVRNLDPGGIACGGLAVCFHYTTETFGSAAATTIESYFLSPSPDDATPAGPRISYFHDGDPNDLAPSFDQLSNFARSNLEGGAVRTFNAERNRLLSIPGEAPHSYTYDDAGYVVDRDGVTLVWDGAGRIASVGADATFEWDTRGRPVSRTVNGVETRRLFGGSVEADSSGDLLALDLGEVRIDLTTSGSSEYLYRHYDFRGNVKFTTDKDGDVVAHYHYGPFGQIDVVGSPGSSEESQGFAQGRTYEGLVLLGHRLLDSDAGQFLAPDPVYQLINQHSYAMGNPVWLWDPSGLQAQQASVAHGAFLVAGGALATFGGLVSFSLGIAGAPTGIAAAGAIAGGLAGWVFGIETMVQGFQEIDAATSPDYSASMLGDTTKFGPAASLIGLPIDYVDFDSGSFGGLGGSFGPGLYQFGAIGFGVFDVYSFNGPGLPLSPAGSLFEACGGSSWQDGGFSSFSAPLGPSRLPPRLLLLFLPLVLLVSARLWLERRRRRGSVTASVTGA